MTLSWYLSFNHTCQDGISKRGPIHRFQGLMHEQTFWRTTIQPTTGGLQGAYCVERGGIFLFGQFLLCFKKGFLKRVKGVPNLWQRYGAEEWARRCVKTLYGWMVLCFNHRLTSDETDSQCSNYILQQSRTAGCLLEAKEDEILCFSIWNGTRLLLNKCQWISAYCKYQKWTRCQVPLSYSNFEETGLLENSSWYTHWTKMCHGTLSSNREREREKSPPFPSIPPPLVFLGAFRVGCQSRVIKHCK